MILKAFYKCILVSHDRVERHLEQLTQKDNEFALELKEVERCRKRRERSEFKKFRTIARLNKRPTASEKRSSRI